jgi:hypothetical protein
VVVMHCGLAQCKKQSLSPSLCTVNNLCNFVTSDHDKLILCQINGRILFYVQAFEKKVCYSVTWARKRLLGEAE